MFNAVCECGHVFIASNGSDLEERCRRLQVQGISDTEVVKSEDCEFCKREMEDIFLANPSLIVDAEYNTELSI